MAIQRKKGINASSGKEVVAGGFCWGGSIWQRNGNWPRRREFQAEENSKQKKNDMGPTLPPALIEKKVQRDISEHGVIPHKLFRARFSGEMSTLGSGHLPSSRSHCNLLPCGSRSGHSLGGCSHRGQEGPARSIQWDIDGRVFLEPPPPLGVVDVLLESSSLWFLWRRALSLFLLPLLLLLRLHCRLLFLSASWRAPASSPLLTLHALPGWPHSALTSLLTTPKATFPAPSLSLHHAHYPTPWRYLNLVVPK